MRHQAIPVSTLLLAGLLAASGYAEDLPANAAEQIAAAVTPAPEDLRDGASVLGYAADGSLVTLREGEGDLMCLADNPSDERFHVACYFKALDPFMARGRQLRAAGQERNEITATREQEIEAGTLEMPTQPTALYSYTGPAGSYDAASGAVTGANHVYVVYIPYATSAETGLSDKPVAGAPWLMAAGKPWAHIMLVQPPAETEDDES